MNEELRIQRCEQYGSFLYCPLRDTLCFGRFTDKECEYDSCILDDPEYQKLKKTIERNRRRKNACADKDNAAAFTPPSRPKKQTAEERAWKEIREKEEAARVLYRKNKPKIADGLMVDAMYLRRCLVKEGKKNDERKEV